ncbi:unnamed protein product [Clonostachys chloroleuca]|uniref:Uncharacterized protein n=1 Tax=Clonostachys chloroleuca TaxID=1926264 RepID=A0AA35M5Z9_9HYPO|nr:unnamed protein product [Clonostachys chloroleuca]
MRLTAILTVALSVIGLGIGLGILFADNLTATCIGFGHMPSMPTQVSPYEDSTTSFILEQVWRIEIVADLGRLAELKYGNAVVNILGPLEDLSTDKDVNASVSVVEPHYSWMEVEGFAAFDGLRTLRESILSDPSDCTLITGGYFTRLSTVLRLPQITREQLAGRIQSITLHLHTLDALQKEFRQYDKSMSVLESSICQRYIPQIASTIELLSDGEGKQSAEATDLLDRAESDFYRLKILCLELKRSKTLRDEVRDVTDGTAKTITESLKTIESLERDIKYARKIDSWASRKLDKQLLEVLEKEIEYFGNFFTDF